MGMRSTFQEQNIDIINKEKLLKYIDKNDWGCVIQENGEIDFSYWSEWKIQGYWYDECVDFLKNISRFIEGYAQFSYEDGDTPFRIVFRDEGVFLLESRIVWDGDLKEIS